MDKLGEIVSKFLLGFVVILAILAILAVITYFVYNAAELVAGLLIVLIVVILASGCYITGDAMISLLRRKYSAKSRKNRQDTK